MVYYLIKDSIVPVDEDHKYEFKAHRNFSSDEIPVWKPDGTKVNPSCAKSEFFKLKNADRTRQPISRNICGFLNSGEGGTILLGVLDSGRAVGLSLNTLQKDHLLLSVEDALRRFEPPVPLGFLKVQFIHVIKHKDDLKDLEGEEAKLCEPSADMRRQPHHLRTSSLCWCDLHAKHRYELGFMSPQYVVEVKVAALHPRLRTEEVTRLLASVVEHTTDLRRIGWPPFTSEDGNLFVRVLNSLVKYTKEDIIKFNTKQVEEFLRCELRYMLSTSEEEYDATRMMRLQSLFPNVTVTKAHLLNVLREARIRPASLVSPVTIAPSTTLKSPSSAPRECLETPELNTTTPITPTSSPNASRECPETTKPEDPIIPQQSPTRVCRETPKPESVTPPSTPEPSPTLVCHETPESDSVASEPQMGLDDALQTTCKLDLWGDEEMDLSSEEEEHPLAEFMAQESLFQEDSMDENLIQE